jgi:opacity protein-like surface antigen
MEAYMFRRFGFIVAAGLIAVVPAAAQEKPVQINIGGGYTGVYGAGKDHVGSGGNFTLGVIFHTKSPISFQGEYGWNGMKQKQLSIPVFPTPLGDTTGVPTDFFADANMQYGDFNVILGSKSGAKTAPYGIVGLGVYYRPVQVSTPGVGYATVCDPYWYVCYPALVPVEQVVGKRSSTDFGMDFGGGVNFKMSDHASIYFEVRYHYIWGPTVSNTSVNPLATPTTVKANGQFLPITVGVRF